MSMCKATPRFLAAAFLLAAAACLPGPAAAARGGPAPAGRVSADKQGPSAPRAEAKVPAEEIVTLATVGAAPITSRDLDAELGGSLQLGHTRSTEEKRRLIDAALQRLIGAGLLAQEAARRGLESSPRYTVPLALMRERGLADSYIRATYGKRFAATEEELKPFTPREWVQLKLRGIFFGTREEAEAARPDILANGDRFDQMWEKYSSLQTGKKGDLGYMFPGLGYFADEDDLAVFSLKKGEISQPVGTEVAWAIVKVEDRRVLDQAEIDALLSEAKRKVRDDKMGRHIHDLEEGLDFRILGDALQVALRDELAFRRPDQVVMEIEGKKVTFADLQKVIPRLPETFVTTVNAEVLSSTYRSFMEQLVMAVAVAREARGAGFAAPAGDAWTVKAERTLLARVLGEDVLKSAAVTEEEVRGEYEKNEPRYHIKELLTIGEIVLSDESFARMVRESVTSGAKSFQRVAADVTEDPTGKLTGGVRSVAELSLLPEEFRELIAKTGTGEITPVTRGSDGNFHIFKVVSRERDYQVPYENIRWELARSLLREKQEKILYDFVEGLKEKTPVKLFEENIRVYATGTRRHGR